MHRWLRVISLCRPLLSFRGTRMSADFLVPRIAKYVYPNQQEQIPENYEFVSTFIVDLLKIAEKPRLFRRIEQSAKLWFTGYQAAAEQSMKKRAWVTNTIEDMQIDFEPTQEYAQRYSDILTLISFLGKNILGSPEKVEQGCNVMDAVHTMAFEAYAKEPSCFPRYTNHNNIALQYVQKRDPPVNCSPTLHGLNSDMAQLLARHWNLDDEVVAYLTEQAEMMPTVILRFKQHSLSDLAVARFTAGLMCRTLGLSYEDITEAQVEAAQKAGIDLTPMVINREILEKIAERKSTPLSLAGILNTYYKERGFPKADEPGEHNLYTNGTGKPIPYNPNNSIKK